MPDESPHQTILTDQALTDPEADLFKRRPFAERVASTIASLSDPSCIVVGIFGDWGQGKTTVLNFMKSKLEGDSRVIIVPFNPWRFSSEDELLLSFFTTLSRTVGKEIKSTHAQFSEAIDKYSFLLKPTRFLPGLNVEKVAEEVAKVIGRDSVEDLKANLGNILRSSGKRVVVFMDDIDRLDRHEIQAVFRLIKLSADFDNTAYVLFFDDEMVAAALKEQYGGGDLAAGRAFLEKVVQVPLHLPSISQIAFDAYFDNTVKQALRDAEVELAAEQWATFTGEFGKGLRDRLKTPRMCKRYANALTFALSLLRGNVNVVDLMLLEGVRLLRPEFYGVLRTRADMLMQSKVEATRIVEETYPEADQRGRTAATNLVRFLFSVAEPEATAQQRLASRRYSSRYFSYAVPAEQVADEEMAAVFHIAESDQIEQVRETVTQIVGRYSTTPQDFLVLLRGRLFQWPTELAGLSPVAFAKLAAALASLEDVFQANVTSRPRQLSIVIVDLIQRISSPSARFEALQQVFEQSVTVAQIYECLKLLTDPGWPASNTLVHALLTEPVSPPWRLLNMKREQADGLAVELSDPSLHVLWGEWYEPLAQTINTRVLQAVADDSLFMMCDAPTGRDLLSGVLPHLPEDDFTAWKTEVKSHVEERIQQVPATAVILIDWFSRSDLENPEFDIAPDEFDTLDAVASARVLYEAVAEAFPKTVTELIAFLEASSGTNDFFRHARRGVQNDAWEGSLLAGDQATVSGTQIEYRRESIVRFLAINLWRKHEQRQSLPSEAQSAEP